VPPSAPEPRIAYVLKVYPRFSETFIVTELLAHERAGADLEIVSLRPPTGGRFHPAIGAVRAPVTYLPAAGIKALDLWTALRAVPGAALLLDDPDAEDPRDVHQAALLAAHVRERGIEHLHAHFASSAATVARLAARMAGVTWSVTAHAKDIFHEDVDPARLALRLADASAVVTVSAFNAAHLAKVAPAAAGRLHRVYNGLDLQRLRPAPLAGRSGGIVAVGRLVEKKGLGDLVDACALLARAGRPVSCRIVGEGPLEGELRSRIAEHGLGEQVVLLGPRTQEEVVALVRDAAVLAAPCVVGADGNRDGLPTVLLEALALGTPAVATPVTGIPELIRHGRTGLLVPERDPAALAAALARLLDDPALAARLAAAGRALVESSFDVERNAARLRDLVWPRVLAEAA
jgi:glycosyltransferase involved in cell wall biosynthesis